MVEKKCKYCAMMIPEDAKVCPHCRKKQGMGFFKALGALLLIFFIISMFSVALSPPHTKTASQPSPMAPEETLTPKGKKVKDKHPGWSNDICNTIAEKKIRVGFTSEQAAAAWGKPYKINTTTGTYGTSEQWVMYDSIDSSYLYFDNGILTSIQQSN